MEGAVSSNIFLRAVFFGAALFVVGFADAKLSSVANLESIGAELLSARHHDPNEQEDDANVKNAGADAHLQRRSAKSELLTKPTSSRLVDEGQCQDSSCIASWISGVDDFNSLKPLSIIDPAVAFRAVGKGNKGLKMTVLWRTPVSKHGLMPYNISHYQVMLDYGSRYQVYKVDELAVSAGTDGNGRVRQWLHVSSVGSERPRVFVRPIYQVADDHSEELSASSEMSVLPQSDHEEIKKPELVGEIKFSDHGLEKCVHSAAHSGADTPISDVVLLNCLDKGITDLQGLEHLTALRSLLLARNPVRVIDNVARLIELEVIDLSGTFVQDFSVLRPENHPWLEKVYLDGTKLTDLSHIARLESLKVLSASNTEIKVVPEFSSLIIQYHCCPTNFQNSTRACCGLGGLGLGGPELNSSIMGLRSNRLSLSSRNICCMLRLERLMNFR